MENNVFGKHGATAISHISTYASFTTYNGVRFITPKGLISTYIVRRYRPMAVCFHRIIYCVSHFISISDLDPWVAPRSLGGTYIPGWHLYPWVAPRSLGGTWIPGWHLVPWVAPRSLGGTDKDGCCKHLCTCRSTHYAIWITFNLRNP